MKTGILLINLGTPNAPTSKDVRRYLRQFLMDPRVIDLPYFARLLILELFILPFRPKKSAAAYKKIWRAEGSPLLYHGNQLKDEMQSMLGNNFLIELGMRYGNPSIESGLERLIEKHCKEIIIVPLFPQYSSAANGSAIECVLKSINKKWNLPPIKVMGDFATHPAFINAYASTIKENIDLSSIDLLLMSYHGLPERHLIKSECSHVTDCRTQDCPTIQASNYYCYRAQCFATSRDLAKALNLSSQQYKVSFQSRLGRTPWIKPYTDLLLPELAKQGIKKIAIVCPSFVADCLETSEEIGIRAKTQWQELGGESIQLIPCLNATPIWVKGLCDILNLS